MIRFTNRFRLCYQPRCLATLLLLAASGASAAASGEAHASPSLLSFDPGVSVWALLTFILLLVVLKRFAWGPILASVEAREKQIRDSLERANFAQNESRRIAMEQNKILAEAKSEAQKILQNVRVTAEELKAKIEAQAQIEKQRILESTEKEILAAKTAAIVELRQSTAELAIQMSEKLLRGSIGTETHAKLVEQLIAEIDTKEVK